MPDVVMHTVIAQNVQSALPQEIKLKISDDPFYFASYGPDIWFLYRPWQRRQGRGRCMHTTQTGPFLMTLAKACTDSSAKDRMFSYLAGFLCHYALDSIAHPYVIWETTEVHHRKEAHRTFEHRLDMDEMEKSGTFTGSHPITSQYLLHRSLPSEMESDLNEVYRSVYGWQNCRKALNASYRRYRALYRLMENPRGFLSRLARKKNTDLWRSISIPDAYFTAEEVENESHSIWKNPFAPEIESSESFSDLFVRSKKRAAELITASYQFIYLNEIDESTLAKLIGARSYFSGLDWKDPRNRTIPSLLPPQ